MRHASTTALLAFALTSAAAFAQVAPNPTQRSPSSPQDPVLLYHVTLVGRTTPAINYRPRHDDTPLDFAGTSLLPKAEPTPARFQRSPLLALLLLGCVVPIGFLVLQLVCSLPSYRPQVN